MGNGRFLVLEGIDGCGKTTQLEALRQWLPDSGLMPEAAALVVSREPGGTPLGQALRQLLLQPPQAAAPTSRSELLLYAADRAQHVDTVIRPALERGDWLLCDRFTGSTAAYQGDGRGLSLQWIDQLELTIWLDLPLAEAQRRLQDRQPDRIEASGEAFQRRVAAGFGRLARERGWRRVAADQAPAAVSAAIQALLQAELGAETGHG